MTDKRQLPIEEITTDHYRLRLNVAYSPIAIEVSFFKVARINAEPCFELGNAIWDDLHTNFESGVLTEPDLAMLMLYLAQTLSRLCSS